MTDPSMRTSTPAPMPLFAGEQPLRRSRSSDPSTSYAAEKKITACGLADSQRALCLECVRKHPGLTAAEIAVRLGLERHIPSRRLPELRTRGEAISGNERTCNVTGNLSLTWSPV